MGSQKKEEVNIDRVIREFIKHLNLENVVSTNIHCGKSLMFVFFLKKKKQKQMAKKAPIKQKRESGRKIPKEGKGQFPIVTIEFVLYNLRVKFTEF